MRKLIAITLVVLLSISLVGCGLKASSMEGTDSSSTSSQLAIGSNETSSSALEQYLENIQTPSSITTSQIDINGNQVVGQNNENIQVQSDLAEIEAMLDETEKLLAELDDITASDVEIPNP